ESTLVHLLLVGVLVGWNICGAKAQQARPGLRGLLIFFIVASAWHDICVRVGSFLPFHRSGHARAYALETCLFAPPVHTSDHRQLQVGVVRTEIAHQVFLTHIFPQSALNEIICVRSHCVDTFQRHEYPFTLRSTRAVELCAQNVFNSSLVMCVRCCIHGTSSGACTPTP
ncbi:unnamed protein product, partial [Ectocarpus sp. 4 AP-2014]